VSSETENQHLKELLKRLQDENISLRNTAFTFSIPRNGEQSDDPFGSTTPSFASSPTSVFASTSHLPSPSSTVAKVMTPQSSSLDTPSAFPADIDFGSLTPVDSMNLLDDSDSIMSYDFGFGQFVPSKTPYKTIASDPRFMSFADPGIPGTTLTSKSSVLSTSPNVGSPYELTFGQWTGQPSTHEGNSQATSLDELLGGNIFGTQSPTSLDALIKSAVTSPVTTVTSPMSPVTHQSVPSPSSGPGSNSNPSFESSDRSSTSDSPGLHGDGCPKTRAQMQQHIQAAGSSIFAPPPPQENEPRTVTFKAPAGADGPVVICKGASFPRTEKSDKNVEVLVAWKSIISHPRFKASVSNSPHTSGVFSYAHITPV
jgi:AP-1-like transcription factor